MDVSSITVYPICCDNIDPLLYVLTATVHLGLYERDLFLLPAHCAKCIYGKLSDVVDLTAVGLADVYAQHGNDNEGSELDPILPFPTIEGKEGTAA